MRDGRLNELDVIEHDMDSLSPRTSTWQKLKARRDALYAELFPEKEEGTI